MDEVLAHRDIQGTWRVVDGQLRNIEEDALRWIRHSVPGEFIRGYEENMFQTSVYIYTPTIFSVGKLMVFTEDTHVEWWPARETAREWPERSFMNPVDTVSWLLYGPLSVYGKHSTELKNLLRLLGDTV